jgi:hypothetical protein
MRIRANDVYSVAFLIYVALSLMAYALALTFSSGMPDSFYLTLDGFLGLLFSIIAFVLLRIERLKQVTKLFAELGDSDFRKIDFVGACSIALHGAAGLVGTLGVVLR